MTRKEQIFATAMTLFAQQGYDGTPTSQIAREAGVSEGLIFRHFGNKAGLLEAMIGEGLAQIAQSFAPYQEEGDPRTAIRRHIERSGQLLREHLPFWRLAHRIRYQTSVQTSAAASITQVNDFILTQLTEHFRKLPVADPAGEARLLFAALDGVAQQFTLAPETYPLEETLALLAAKFIIPVDG